MKGANLFYAVQGWACAMCSRVHGSTSEADECCACGECGGKFKHANSFDSRCDGCSWGMDVRAARATVRRNTAHLKSSEENLARLLAKKPRRAAQS